MVDLLFGDEVLLDVIVWYFVLLNWFIVVMFLGMVLCWLLEVVLELLLVGLLLFFIKVDGEVVYDYGWCCVLS